VQWFPDDYPFYSDLKPILIGLQSASEAPEVPCTAERQSRTAERFSYASTAELPLATLALGIHNMIF
jgi:hypothetical protein